MFRFNNSFPRWIGNYPPSGRFAKISAQYLHLSDRSLLEISIQVRRQRREVVEVMSAKVGDLAISGEWEEIKTAFPTKEIRLT